MPKYIILRQESIFMKKILNILITIILLGTLVACQEEVSFMQVSSDKEYHLTTKGGKIDINVNASERPISTGMSAWLHTEITDHGPQEYVVTITADRNLSGKERKAEAVIRVNDELRELITVHQEYRKDSLATNESVFECLPEVTQMTIEYSSTLPIDSLILLCEAPYVKATLAENRIELSLDLNISLEDRSFDVVLTTADEYVNTLIRNADGMVQFDDAAFKKAVLEMHDTDGDGDLSIKEAEAIEHLDVSGKDIRNLNGVGPMRNLRSLDFRNNPKLYKIINNNGADIPGAKGCPDEMLKQAGENGVSKINVDTDLRLAMTAQIRRVFNEEPSVFDPRKYLGAARDEIKKTVSHKINDVFCSANKA